MVLLIFTGVVRSHHHGTVCNSPGPALGKLHSYTLFMSSRRGPKGLTDPQLRLNLVH